MPPANNHTKEVNHMGYIVYGMAKGSQSLFTLPRIAIIVAALILAVH